MFSPDVVQSDAFLEMSASTQALYFQLGMRADDDGFVNPRMVMRLLGSNDDELKILIHKRFVLPFDNGVLVIKHWRINNQLRKDWHRPTMYIEQRDKLFIKDNGAYTLDEKQGKPLLLDARYRTVNEPLTQYSIVKYSIDKNSIDTMFDEFWKSYPRKIAKPNARKAWMKLRPTEAIAKKIIAGVEKWKTTNQWKKDDGQFIPHPATFLNQQRWEDEISGKVVNTKYSNVSKRV